MKFIWITVLGAIIVFGIIYKMNQVALTPADGLTASGQKVEMSGSDNTPSDSKFEPLDLSMGFSLIRSAHAEAAPNAQAVQNNQTLARLETRTLGNENAPIKMYVFSSLTCSHCAKFHTHTIKAIENSYVKNGQVFFTYIDFPFDVRAVGGAMLARCMPQSDYFKFLNLLFENQANWAFKPNAREILTTYASLQGMSAGDVRACFADNVLKNKIITTRDVYMKKYDITGTPTTVLIKGDKTEIVAGADEKKINKILADWTK